MYNSYAYPFEFFLAANDGLYNDGQTSWLTSCRRLCSCTSESGKRLQRNTGKCSLIFTHQLLKRLQQELSEVKVVHRGQPNLNNNSQLARDENGSLSKWRKPRFEILSVIKMKDYIEIKMINNEEFLQLAEDFHPWLVFVKRLKFIKVYRQQQRRHPSCDNSSPNM